MNDFVVEVNQLSKRYGKTYAVQQISFQLERNKVYGLLGRNGAGKTTLMRMLTAQLIPTSGQVKVFGEEPFENRRVLEQICFVKESQKYPDHYRVRDVVEISKLLFPNWDPVFADQLVADFQLPLNQKVKKLSRGMLSSVGIIIGLASRAPLTIFDEPYLGLDAVARQLFYDRLMEDYVAHPRTIVLSTHLIDEMNRLLEHILVIDQGQILLDEEADHMRERAYTVAGARKKVEQFIQGKAVIDRASFGALLTATVNEKLDDGERMRAEKEGLELAPVSLQQLIVELTKEKVVSAEKGGDYQ